MIFDVVDKPATEVEEICWWGRFGVQLVGFIVAGHEGEFGMTHWVVVTTAPAERTVLYLLCGTMDDELPWRQVRGADIRCMTCLVLASRPGWTNPR